MLISRFINACLRRVGFNITSLPPAGRNESLPPLGHNPFSAIIQLVGAQSIGTIFDVGANVGQTATKLAKTFPESTIYSFEPNPDAFDELRSATQRLSNVLPFNVALGHQDGDTTLFLNKDSATNSLLHNSAQLARFADGSAGVTPIGSVAVKVRRLDTFCRENGVHSVDLLKIDTQGYELKVLEGAGRLLECRHIKFIYLEVLFVSLYEQQAEFFDVYRELSRHGYGFVGLYGLVRDKEGFLKWGDALFMAEQSDGGDGVPAAHQR